MITASAVRSYGQEPDSALTAVGEEETTKKHSIEFGLNTLGAGVEYRYEVIPFVSTDVVFAAGPPGIGVGLSLVPLTYVFAQGVYGASSYQEVATVDGPAEFRPDFAYAWRAGVHVPLNPKRGSFFLVLSGGDVWLVQNEYCSNCGGFLTGPPPAAPEYRKETKHFQVYGFGLVYKF
ncbi:MAG: hypothetical protein HY562_05715 [Ignavibacteriales bacterium]|nr:hypothetical protein [Ignavibacteriales bacterium]